MTSGIAAKLSVSISMPVEISRPVFGHEVQMIAMAQFVPLQDTSLGEAEQTAN
jgi:hypothetical protein